MTRQERPREPMPEFKSRAEAAEWFDTHDISDYLDEFDVVEAQVDRNLTRSLNVRLAPDVYTKLERKAQEKGIGTSTLVRMWIMQLLHETETTGSN